VLQSEKIMLSNLRQTATMSAFRALKQFV